MSEIGVPEELKAAARQVSNWGRWGEDDELGTLNFITPELVVQAAGLVQTGRTYSLSAPLDAYGPQGAHGFRRNPIHLMMLDGGDREIDQSLDEWGGETETRIKQIWRGPMRFNDDYVMMPLQAATQWDALSHVYYDGQLYNGFDAATVTSLGAVRDSIDKVAAAGKLIGRGVLLDVARRGGTGYLEAGTVIGPDSLQATADAQGVEIRDGDIVLVRTGWWQRFQETRDGEDYSRNAPGLNWQCALWLSEKRVAAIASDNSAVENTSMVFPGVVLPFHMLALRDMGLMLGEMWNLEALAAACDEDHRYEFMLVAQPLLFTGAVGSPVNPVAIK